MGRHRRCVKGKILLVENEIKMGTNEHIRVLQIYDPNDDDDGDIENNSE